MNRDGVGMKSNELMDHLVLHPPSSPESAPAAFRFNRFRQIEIPWETVLEDPPGAISTHFKLGKSEQIRDFFLRSWRENR